ncbi:unnamed protein product [Lasius platythorax]|uniref:Transposase n=1 Tax=Lasius platythorax TaxID=488582 RepID=A0AAV2P2A8_9HYME
MDRRGGRPLHSDRKMAAGRFPGHASVETLFQSIKCHYCRFLTPARYASEMCLYEAGFIVEKTCTAGHWATKKKVRI